MAAAQRAKSAIEQYDGAPSTQQALEILMFSYDRMNLPQLANQTREVYAANYSKPMRVAAQAEIKKPWWKLW